MKKLILGDCFDRLRNIHDRMMDMVLFDPPYGKTNLSWDKPFPVSILNEILRVIRDDGVIMIFGREPMLSYFRVHYSKFFRYDLIWKKNRKNGYVLCKDRPLQETEKIAVFSKGNFQKNARVKMRYFPALSIPCHIPCRRGKIKPKYFSKQEVGDYTRTRKGFPTDLIECDQEWKAVHPTEKPIQLYEYLILMHTQLGDTILDPCFGSGNALLAAKTLNRNFIGIEKEQEWFDYAKQKLL